MTPDHYPWNDATLAIPPPIMPPAQRFVKRGFYMVCCACGLAVEWCKCRHGAPDPPALDGSETSLAKRVQECQGRR